MDTGWYVTWQEVADFIDEVVDYYKEIHITGVYGCPRGGIILASIISSHMNIPMLMAPSKDCIIIDDIADSGETLLHYDRNSSAGGIKKGYHIVTMFYKETSSVKPEFFKYLKTDKWIVFPWEAKYYATQQKVDEFINEVIQHFQGVHITGVYGFSLGGLILASILSYRMKISMFLTPTRDCLIIGDTSNIGETLLLYECNSSKGSVKRNYHIVTSLFKGTNEMSPDFSKCLNTEKHLIYSFEA